MLVIFDCDGVLVDSEVLAASIFSETLRDIGWHYSAEQCLAQFQGQSLAYCFDWLENDTKKPLPKDLPERLDRNTQRGFQSSLEAVDGVECLIQYLNRRNIAFCVASNGSHQKIVHSLHKVGLLGYFPEGRRFSIDDVRHGKPSPELFLHAADVLGVPSGFCCVIEDSLSGCRAASQAEMPFIYFHSAAAKIKQEIRLLEPTGIAHSMSEILSSMKSVELASTRF